MCVPTEDLITGLAARRRQSIGATDFQHGNNVSGIKTMSTTMDALVKALLDGDQVQAVAEAAGLRDSGVEHERIVTEGIEAAMEQLNGKCTMEQFNLLEIMLAGRAVMGVMKELYPPGAPQMKTKGTIVIASPEGDVHDLGKNILKVVLTAKAYRVVDCGKDCPTESLIEAARREEALAVAVSGLMTSLIPQVRQIRDKMTEHGLGHVKIIAGGAALKQASAESLNVDFVAQNAFDGARYIDQIAGGGR
jgi:dimethylamine corrinoid protein